MDNNSLKAIKIDRNMSQLWKIVCKEYDLYIVAFVGCIVWTLNIGYSTLLPIWPASGNTKNIQNAWEVNCKTTFYKQIEFILYKG